MATSILTLLLLVGLSQATLDARNHAGTIHSWGNGDIWQDIGQSAPVMNNFERRVFMYHAMYSLAPAFTSGLIGFGSQPTRNAPLIADYNLFAVAQMSGGATIANLQEEYYCARLAIIGNCITTQWTTGAAATEKEAIASYLSSNFNPLMNSNSGNSQGQWNLIGFQADTNQGGRIILGDLDWEEPYPGRLCSRD